MFLYFGWRNDLGLDCLSFKCTQTKNAFKAAQTAASYLKAFHPKRDERFRQGLFYPQVAGQIEIGGSSTLQAGR